MESKEILNYVKKLSVKEKRELSYKQLVGFINKLSKEEIIKLSNIIGYPVFTRLCMNELQHKFVLLQDGAAAIIVNKKKEILLQSRADRNKWGLPGGCQELGESFEDTILREVKEETNLDVLKKDLKLIDVISGKSRKNEYPNGDMVINNTVLYYIDTYNGNLKWDEESKEMKFFSLDNLPLNQNDKDLIERYEKYLNEISS